jgi:hypothetical protein
MNGPATVLTLAPPRAIAVTVTEDTLSVDLEDGRSISVPIGWYPRLAYGTPTERTNCLDEDLSVEGLLLGRSSQESPTSFQRWLDRRRQAAS